MKKIIGIAISVLMATLFCVTAFAVEPRWKNVIAISPTISAESQSYSSYIVADPKATKMECTLVLYEKWIVHLLPTMDSGMNSMEAMPSKQERPTS